MDVIIVILIMNIGWFISIGFEKQLLLGSDQVRSFSEVIDLYVLRFGIGLGRYSFGTAVGIFRSVVSLILVFSSNLLARRLGRGSII